jgi:hypothetical protein
MTKIDGLEIGDIDIMDEEYFGPPPRFLVEGNGPYDTDMPSDQRENASFFPGISSIRKLMGAW